MWSTEILVLIAVVFLFAGFVKGIVGLGMPTVSLALLATTIGLKPAIALLLAPALFTNVWQGLSGPHLRTILARLWPFLLCICVGTWFGAGVLATAEASRLMAVLGLALVIYASLSLTMFQIPAPGRFEKFINPVMGVVAGFMTGMTGSFVVPGSLYLQTLNMPRDTLIQALGISFVTVSVALGLSMGNFGLISPGILVVSALAVIPASIGMAAGVKIRRRVPEEKFRQVFFGALWLLGAYISVRAFLI
jgi:hypothetical protein